MNDLNIYTPINKLGYGIAGLNITKSLSKLKNVALFPIGQISCDEEDIKILRKCVDNSSMPNMNAPCVKIWHQNDMSLFVGKGERIGFPFFELNRFNEIEKHHLSSLDKVIVASSWAKNIVASETKVKEENIFIAPLGVNSSIFKPSKMNEDGPTIFFNCGKWELRKGHDILLKAFSKAFTAKDDVELWMMCENPFLTTEESDSWRTYYKDSDMGDKIKILPRVDSCKEVYNNMKSVHCGVFPSRAEGWNLEILELMSCGKHIITTDYSAHTEFCNKENSMLISIDSTEKAYDGKFFREGDGEWAELKESQLDQLTDYLKLVHQKHKTGELAVNSFGIETSNKFSWDNCAKEILKSC